MTLVVDLQTINSTFNWMSGTLVDVFFLLVFHINMD